MPASLQHPLLAEAPIGHQSSSSLCSVPTPESCPRWSGPASPLPMRTASSNSMADIPENVPPPASLLRKLQPALIGPWKQPPLERRYTVGRQRRQVLFVPGGSGACGFEPFTFPVSSSCLHCSCQLSADEARGGVGLCARCYGEAPKSCLRCRRTLPVKAGERRVKRRVDIGDLKLPQGDYSSRLV
ncbi:unnamed protein product [Effrenium voratum]|nr:unnamed protein product [Effrenium voratum]